MLKAFEKNIIEYLATAATYFRSKIILKMRFKNVKYPILYVIAYQTLTETRYQDIFLIVNIPFIIKKKSYCFSNIYFTCLTDLRCF